MFPLKLLYLVGNKKTKKKNLNLQPFSENSLSEELERNICPQPSGLQLTGERESRLRVRQSVKGGGI